MKQSRKRLVTGAVLLAAVVLLSLPERRSPVDAPAASSLAAAHDSSATVALTEGEPFRWDSDALWEMLEKRFVSARGVGCGASTTVSAAGIRRINDLVAQLRGRPVRASDARWTSLESALFEVAPLVAACPANAQQFVSAYSQMRIVLKDQSVRWDLDDRAVRERLYRLMYGGRAAVEEVLLQMDGDSAAALARIMGHEETLDLPSAIVEGVRVYSGDILVSRGGFPTSALIARGSDFPGNFSHVALLHVNKNGVPSVVEAHIERGLTVATVDEYLADKKLRIMLLRPRQEVVGRMESPDGPHIAASRARTRAFNAHVPYDFEMNYTDPAKLFCSEVASSVYREQGVELWTGISTISAPGLRDWLGGFGVTHFETQEPSDLEYDPQLVVVAEWRDPETLYRDHVHNAVVDAMLEGADAGDRLRYNPASLPVARVAKAYSVVLNGLGRVGPIPEGMSPGAALRSRSYTRRHDELVEKVMTDARRFEEANGYRPPYWELVAMARSAVSSQRG